MNFVPSVRLTVREQNIDINSLIAILRLRRKAGSETEEKFVQDFLDPIPGMQQDGYGNRILRIGDNPTVLWSCHTDTVTAKGGHQNVRWRGNLLELNDGKPGQSLGADDGAGLWLLLEMIKAGRPGLYIFHREEEIGGKGSGYLSKHEPEILNGIQMAIAFDRKGTTSVITHQSMGRCCSDNFGKALAAKLGPAFTLDPTGTFTDTANYMDLVPECCNVSIGYQNEHGHRETLDVAYLLRLRETMLMLDASDLPVERDPKDIDDDYYGYTFGGSFRNDEDPIEDLYEITKVYPYMVAKIFHELGVTAKELEETISRRVKDEYKLPEFYLDKNFEDDIIPLADNLSMHCYECALDYEYYIAGYPNSCPECGSSNTVMGEFHA